MTTLIGLVTIGSSSLGDLTEDRDHLFVSTYGRFTLDLTQSRFPENGTVKTTFVSLFGRPTIMVPSGIAVETAGFTLLGKNKNMSATPSGRPVGHLMVNRYSLFGGSLVRTSAD